jgi:GDP-4-dehydro-6-deoxy-D-mannose reductase
VSAILVTGARGFVGGQVVAAGRAHGLDVREAAGDLRDPDVATALVREHRPAAVVHLAAAHRARGLRAWDTLRDDLAMTAALVQALAQGAPEAVLVAAGSAAQYGLGRPERLREQDTAEPVSAYGVAKCVIERALLADPLRGGLRVVWARAFNHVGPGQGLDAPLPQWARQVAEAEQAGGGQLRTGRLDVVRDFLDVRDVADAYLALAASPEAAGVVNLCSGDGLALTALVERLVAEAHADIEVVPDPALLRGTDPPVVVGDPSRLRALTGWSPRRSPLDAVGEVLDRWRAEITADAPLHG